MKDTINQILASYGLKEVFTPSQNTFRLEKLEGPSIQQEWESTKAFKVAEDYFKKNIEPFMKKWQANSVKYKELQALSEAEFSKLIAKYKVNEAAAAVENYCKENNVIIMLERDYVQEKKKAKSSKKNK